MNPAETEALIRALNLTPSEERGWQFLKRPSPSWPDLSTWKGSTLYKGGKMDGLWFYYLRTDAAREQVYLVIGCI